MTKTLETIGQRPADLAVLSAALANAGGARARRAITTKGGVLGGNLSANVSDGVATSATYRIAYRPVYSIYGGVRFRFSNWRMAANGPKSDDLAPITVKASAEFGLSNYPLTFNGQTTVVIQPGADVWSDPVVNLDIGAQLFLYCRTYVSVAAGGRWPLGRYGVGLEGSNLATGGSDQTAGTGNLPSNIADTMFHPTAVEGLVDARAPGNGRAVLLTGDSIMAGAAAGTAGPAGEWGVWERAIGLTANWMTITRTGWAAFRTATTTRTTEFADVDRLCGRAILELGLNDLYGSARPATSLQTDITTIVNRLAARGMAVGVCTITPVSQGGVIKTPASNTQANIYNDWLRAEYRNIGASFLFDMSDIVSTGRNSGIWKPQWEPADGTHPDKMLAEIAAAIPMAQFLAATA